MPLTRESNLEWRAENPGAILYQKDLTYATHKELLSDLFISEEAFNHLKKGADGIPDFWSTRAKTLASQMGKFLMVANQ